MLIELAIVHCVGFVIDHYYTKIINKQINDKINEYAIDNNLINNISFNERVKNLNSFTFNFIRHNFWFWSIPFNMRLEKNMQQINICYDDESKILKINF